MGFIKEFNVISVMVVEGDLKEEIELKQLIFGMITQLASRVMHSWQKNMVVQPKQFKEE